MNCERCGIYIDEIIIYKREKRGDNDTRCRDCRARPSREVKYNNEICRPWWGELDDDFNPIDDKGRLYLAGVRICGHKDCVRREHVIETLEMERVDVSYRTGRQTTVESLNRELIA